MAQRRENLNAGPDPWDYDAAALDAVRKSPHVSIGDLPDGGIAFDVGSRCRSVGGEWLACLLTAAWRTVGLEVVGGSLRVHRSLLGRVAVEEYRAHDVSYFFVEGNVLFMHDGKRNVRLIQARDGRVCRAMATLLGSRLWHPDGYMGAGGGSTRRSRFVVMRNYKFGAAAGRWDENRSLTVDCEAC